MNDVKEAAERLRSYSWMKMNGPVLQSNIFQAFKDMYDVAEAYLASHRPDDDEPIDVEFVKSLGGRLFAIDAIDHFGYDTFCIRHYDGKFVFNPSGYPEIELKTKRDLRQLVELLGGNRN